MVKYPTVLPVWIGICHQQMESNHYCLLSLISETIFSIEAGLSILAPSDCIMKLINYECPISSFWSYWWSCSAEALRSDVNQPTHFYQIKWIYHSCCLHSTQYFKKKKTQNTWKQKAIQALACHIHDDVATLLTMISHMSMLADMHRFKALDWTFSIIHLTCFLPATPC